MSCKSLLAVQSIVSICMVNSRCDSQLASSKLARASFDELVDSPRLASPRGNTTQRPMAITENTTSRHKFKFPHPFILYI